MKNLPINKKLSLMDVGARGGIGWPWREIQNNLLDILLIEPDPTEAKTLKKNGKNHVLDCALWSSEKQLSININKSPGSSSVFRGNTSFLNQFHDAKRFETQKEVLVNARTIDDLAIKEEIESLDFLKIDVQGGELEVLKGGEHFLKNNLVGLEVEVEFASLYENQPLFSDVDSFVRNNLGLELWDLRKTYWKYKQNKYKTPLKGRLIFGDALYLRSLSSLDIWLSKFDKETAAIKLHALIVTSIAYGFLDYSTSIINADFFEDYLTNEDEITFIRYIENLSKSFYPFKNGNRFLYKVFNVLTNSVKPSHNGWGIGESNIGSRKKLFFWI